MHLVDFLPFFNKGDNFCDFLFGFSIHQDTFKKGSTLKRENLLPRGANSSLLKQTPFQKWDRISFDSPPFKVCPFAFKGMDIFQRENMLRIITSLFKGNPLQLKTNLLLRNMSSVSKDITFNSFPISGYFCRLLITFANSLDPDQA